MAFDGTLKFDTKIDTSGFQAGISKLGDFAKAGMAAVTGAITAASGAMAALGTQALNAYADYEQLTGGVATLFGAQDMSIEEYAKSVGRTVDDVKGDYDKLIAAQDAVMQNAAEAYRTAGMSANQYMETVTSFSAALISSLGGDTDKAVSMADLAITDMADNANKMGTDIESLQNAYKNFSKGQFQLLDNLALGYSGSKEGMEKLLADAEKLSGIHYNLESYADIVEAIHVVQTEMGITGTTAKEAAKTISGSIGATKAAWKNFLTGTGTANQFSEMLSVSVGNIRSSLNDIIPRLTEGLTELVDLLAPEIPPIIEETLPAIIEGASTLITGLARSLPQLLTAILPALSDGVINVSVALVTVLPELITSLSQAIPIIVRTIMSKKDDLLKAGKDIIAAILPDNPSELMSKAFQIINHFIESLLSDDNINYILEKAPELIHALAKGITDFLFGSDRSAEGGLFGAVYKVVERFCDYFSDAENRANFESAAADILIELGDFLVENVGLLAKYALKIGQALAQAVITAFLDALIPLFDSEAGWMDEYLKADTNLSYPEWAAKRHEDEIKASNEKTSYVGQSGSYDTSNGMLKADSWDNAAAKEAYRKYRGYASGFVVDRPTWLNRDTIVGEDGTEALLPLEHNTGWMDLFADKLGPRISADAVQAVQAAQNGISGLVQPSPTAAITYNHYYSTTDSRTNDTPPIINVHVHVDAEMDGEKVAEKVAEKVDILQGEAITMDERGTAH